MRISSASSFKALGVLLLAALTLAVAASSSGAAGGYVGNGGVLGGGSGGDPGGPKLQIKLIKGQSKRSARRKGLKLRATCSAKRCRVFVGLFKNHKLVAKGKRKLRGKRGRLRVTFNRRGKRKLAHAGGPVRLKLRARALDRSGRRSRRVGKRIKL